MLTHFPFLLKILRYQTDKSESNVSPFKTIQHQNFLLIEKSPSTIIHFTTIHFSKTIFRNPFITQSENYNERLVKGKRQCHFSLPKST